MNDLAIPFRPVGEALADFAARQPDKTAIFDLDGDGAVTFAELHRAVEKLAVLLQYRGVKPGDRVAVLSDERIEKLLVFLAIWRAGAAACPFHVEMSPDHLRSILGYIAPKLVLWHEDLDGVALSGGTGSEAIRFGDWGEPDGGLFDSLAEIPGEATVTASYGPADTACIFSTSGTTERPKCVIWDHLGLWLCGLSTLDMTGMTGDDRLLEYRTFSWLSPQIIALMPFIETGLTLYIARRFSHGRFFDWIRDHDITMAVGVPTVINMLLSRPVDVTAADLPSLRLMTSSSAPLAPDQWRAFEDKYGIRLTQFYGASEGGWLCGNRHDNRRPGTAGQPAKHMDLAILDPDGDPCPTGIEGEITIRGPQTAVGSISPDGEHQDRTPFRLTERMRTGDLGVMDTDGFVTVTGRAKDLIIRGGVNIAPLEIDGAVMRHADVHEAAAIGIPDPIYGEEIVCYVVPRDGATLDETTLATHCHAALPDFKTPKRFVTIDALPKSDRGKIRREALKEIWARDHGEKTQ